MIHDKDVLKNDYYISRVIKLIRKAIKYATIIIIAIITQNDIRYRQANSRRI